MTKMRASEGKHALGYLLCLLLGACGVGEMDLGGRSVLTKEVRNSSDYHPLHATQDSEVEIEEDEETNFVETVYAGVDPSDYVRIEIIVDDEVYNYFQDTQKDNLAKTIPSLLRHIINSNWLLEVRQMSKLNGNPVVSVNKYEDTFSYEDKIFEKLNVEALKKSSARRSDEDKKKRVPIYLIVSSSNLTAEQQKELDKHISRDQRRRLYALLNPDAQSEFLAWKDEESKKPMLDRYADIFINDYKPVMEEFSKHIATALRSNFFLKGYCITPTNNNVPIVPRPAKRYDGEELTVKLSLNPSGGQVGFLNSESGYFMSKPKDAVFINSELKEAMCFQMKYNITDSKENDCNILP